MHYKSISSPPDAEECWDSAEQLTRLANAALYIKRLPSTPIHEHFLIDEGCKRLLDAAENMLLYR